MTHEHKRTDYVAFIADEHHPLRILPVRMQGSDHDLGSPLARRFDAYARYLSDTITNGKRSCCVTWEPTNDRRGSYPGLLWLDFQEFRAWEESRK